MCIWQGSALGHLATAFALLSNGGLLMGQQQLHMLEPLRLALAACLEGQPAGLQASHAETALHEALADALLPQGLDTACQATMLGLSLPECESSMNHFKHAPHHCLSPAGHMSDWCMCAKAVASASYCDLAVHAGPTALLYSTVCRSSDGLSSSKWWGHAPAAGPAPAAHGAGHLHAALAGEVGVYDWP